MDNTSALNILNNLRKKILERKELIKKNESTFKKWTIENIEGEDAIEPSYYISIISAKRSLQEYSFFLNCLNEELKKLNEEE